MNTLTAEQVKRLPVGKDVRIVQNDTGKYELGYIVKSGKRKMLKFPLLDPVVIVDRVGYHYERVKDEGKG
jgi:hypothetical protein